MSPSLNKRFIIIDDDTFNILILTHQLNKIISKPIEILSFKLPDEGLNYIKSNYDSETQLPTIIFIDLNMPLISGWDFITEILTLESKVISQLTLYILSSSVDDRDIDRAKQIPIIKDYLTKPLTYEYLKELFGT